MNFTEKEIKNLKLLLESDDDVNLKVAHQITKSIVQNLGNSDQMHAALVDMVNDLDTPALLRFFPYGTTLISDIRQSLGVLLAPFMTILSITSVSASNRINATHLEKNIVKIFAINMHLFVNVKRLSISSIFLDQLIPFVSKLKKLRSVTITMGLSHEISDSIGKLTQINELVVSGYSLSEIPSTIGGLQSLIKLKLNNLRLRKIPPQISKLNNLTHLNLNHNKLTELPDSITYLSELEVLELANNQIHEVTLKLGNLKKLKTLDLATNRVNHLPTSMEHLTKLKYFNLLLNPICTSESKMKIVHKLLPHCDQILSRHNSSTFGW